MLKKGYCMQNVFRRQRKKEVEATAAVNTKTVEATENVVAATKKDDDDEYAICRFDIIDPDEETTIVESYTVGDHILKPTISITKDGRYLVREPSLTAHAESVHRRLMRDIHHSFTYRHINKSDVIPLLKKTLEAESKATENFDVWQKEKEAVEYYMIRDIAGHAELDALIKDPHIEDILVLRWDRPAAVVHKNYPHHTLLESNIVFRSQARLERLIQRVSQWYGEPPTEARPMTSFSGSGGMRYTCTGNTIITPDSPTMSIRKASPSAITIWHLLQPNTGVLTSLAAAYLWAIMDLKGFGLVIGAPSAGKTTMINAIFTMANPDWHYYTIEDVLELKLPHKHISRHQTTQNVSLGGGGSSKKTSNEKDDSVIDAFKLCKLSLRFRPDFVVVGEVLGEEADGLCQTAASGSGCMCSFHASNAEHAITRLQAEPISLTDSQVSLLTYILHMSWILRKGKRQRRLLSITEVVGKDNKLVPIFEYEPVNDTLLPDTIDSVIANSTALQNMGIMLGVSNIKENIQRRIDILDTIKAEKNSLNLTEIHKRISSFYHQY